MNKAGTTPEAAGAHGGEGRAGASAPPVAGMQLMAGAGGTSGTGGSSSMSGTGGMDASAPIDAGSDAAAAGSDAGIEIPRCDPEITQANRTLVASAIDALFVDKDITAVDRFWAEPYLQHNPIAQSGVETFRSLMSVIIGAPSFTYERLLTLADCDLVVVYGRYAQTGVIFDMFRVLDGKIMEHWDSDANQASQVGVLAERQEEAASARALFDMLAALLIAGERTRALFAPTHVEHHGAGATGAEAFDAFLAAESVAYVRVHHVIADGNYVFAISEGTRTGSEYAFYDLFRVQAGKVVEHWDSRRAVPSSTMSGLPIF